MVKKELNDNDNKLLAYCFNRKRFISDIARHIGIDVKNVSVRVKSLKKRGLVKVESSATSNKKFVRTVEGDKTTNHFIEILNELKSRGGIIKEEEFMEILPFYSDKEIDEDKFSAPFKMLYTSPKLVDNYIKITPEGEKFLKDNSK